MLITALTVSGIYIIDRYLGVHMAFEKLPQTLRIMTWNIGKIYLKWDSRASDKDLDYVAQVIREVNPQIVALQELKNAKQIGKLATMLGPKWRAKIPVDEYDRRAGLLTPLPVEFVNLPTSSGRIAPGGIVTLGGGLKIAVASVHLDAFDENRRLEQAEEIMAGIMRLSEQKNILLAGDFNFDVATVAQNSSDHQLYRFLTRELIDAAPYSGATTLISRRLDYVFYRCQKVSMIKSRVLRDKRINIMDHDPLVVELIFKK